MVEGEVEQPKDLLALSLVLPDQIPWRVVLGRSPERLLVTPDLR